MEALGTRVTLATGKFHHLTREYGTALGLETPLVSLDGAHVARNGDEGQRRGIGLEAALEILDQYHDPAWDAFADSGGDCLLVFSARPAIFEESLRPWARNPLLVDDLAAGLEGSPAIVSFYGPQNEIERTAREVGERYPDIRVSVYSAPYLGATRVSFQPRGVSKGSGVSTVLESLGVGTADAMVFGDWHNDRPMFEIGCVNVAMVNAVPELRAKADYVTDFDCEEDGVARFLERHFL